MKNRNIICLVVSALTMGLIAVGSAEPVPVFVENFSFELPGTVKHYNWENVPGWNSDTVAEDSGIEQVGDFITEGLWYAFLKNSDPSVYNLTDHTIAAGDQFTLRIDAGANKAGGRERSDL